MTSAAAHRPRLSLCLIVKNEAETLERCLSLARPHVDEIVVVDTGSTDVTVAIARRYADVVDEIPWPGSFAVARNHSFDLASGDFIMVIDGDEYLPESLHWARVREVLLQPNLTAALVPVKNLLRETQIVAADRIWQERIFRNVPEIRYQGRVHNQIREAVVAYAKRTGGQLFQIEAEIIHTGYALSPEQMKAKYAMRVGLLEAEFFEPRSAVYQAYYGYQLGLVYFILERFADAAAVFEVIDYSLLTKENGFYTRLLATQTGLKLEDPARALINANEMLTIDQTEPVGFFMTGLALLQAHKVGDGMLMLLEAYNMNSRLTTPPRFALNPRVLLSLLAKLCDRLTLTRHADVFRKLREQSVIPDRTVKALIASLQSNIVQAEVAHARA